jgi:hypothetical protein
VVLTVNRGILHSGRSKLGTDNAPAWDYVIGLARLRHRGIHELLHGTGCVHRCHPLLLLCRRRCLIDLLLLVGEVLSLRLNYQAFLRRLGAWTWCATQDLVEVCLVNEGKTMLISWGSHGRCVYVLICSRVNLVCVKRTHTTTWYHIQILRLATLLVGRHRASEATHRIAICLLMLRVTGLEGDVFRVQWVILLVLVGLPWLYLFSVVCSPLCSNWIH